MRPAIVVAIIALALTGPVALAAVVGTGSSVVIAGGGGIDLLVWRDGASGVIKAMRFGAGGAPLDATPLDLPLPAGARPDDAAWDGSGFVIVASGSNALLARLPVSGGIGFTASFGLPAPIEWASVASKEDQTSLIVWSAGSSTYSTSVAADGLPVTVGGLPWTIGSPARLVREPGSYVLASIERCLLSPCSPTTPAIVVRVDDEGNPVGPLGTLTLPMSGSPIWSFAGGSRAVLTAAPESRPAPTTVLSFDPGQLRAAHVRIRFPDPLTAQKTATGTVLIGSGARIDLSENGAPVSTNWAPVPEDQRLAGVLPSSGMRVLAPVWGVGPISVETPETLTSEVGLAPVHVSSESVWLKIDNRGPGSPTLIDLWVTGRVSAFNSLNPGTITPFGSLTRIRFPTSLKPIAGFEVALAFHEPIDPNAFEAWALVLGTDTDATNNYVSTLAVEPEPEPPARRRRPVTRP